MPGINFDLGEDIDMLRDAVVCINKAASNGAGRR